ncbi:universal stress protein [Oricola thermophila]|uniref:Universal stress protein n=1 Tax=Oricola thermophila TaxID=2742145 RepID=A0A6N1VEC0_9HYPH|nr:universal stress protein [Oricola thermophila]QKV18883.1 universal stress protein [Oricola thermophila]
MYNKIMVPVDLAHADKLALALDTAANLAKLYNIPVVYVGVTAPTPGPLGHNPEEYARSLKEFADDQGVRHGIATDSRPVVSHDPAVDLDDALIKAVHETGSNLVVMATHIPNVADHFWPSNGGRLATHTDASVFLVRG